HERAAQTGARPHSRRAWRWASGNGAGRWQRQCRATHRRVGRGGAHHCGDITCGCHLPKICHYSALCQTSLHFSAMRDRFHRILRYLRRHWRWGVRGAITVWLLNALVPAPPRALLGPPQTVETQHPLVCVHTRLVEEVDEWKIQRSLQLVREMGADTIVEFFPWAYVEHTKDEYDWSNVDRIIRHARNQGIHIIARM